MYTTQQKKYFNVIEEPIRAEIFSISRIEAHAESLAKAQTISIELKAGKSIVPRINENQQILEESYRIIIEAVQRHQAISPAAEWLIDNFHIIRGLIKEIKDYLPPQYYYQLPKLIEGHLSGFPRIYGIAWAFVAHTDSRFDPVTLKHFLLAYQRVQTLTIGELWAISITIRLVLIENLRRLSVTIVSSLLACEKADRFANEILGLSETKSRPLEEIMSELEKEEFSSCFVVHLLQRLRFQEMAADPILEWIEKRLHEKQLVADHLVTCEHRSQTAANATMRNIITSSRLISVFDWQNFFEDVSIVTEILKEHSGFRSMDFTSRDRYRHALEDLARYSKFSESEVARRAISLARTAEEKKKLAKNDNNVLNDRTCDPGYYLISSGRRNFEQEIKYKPPLLKLITSLIVKYNTFFYLGSIFFISILLLKWPIYSAQFTHTNFNINIILIIISICGIFTVAEIAINLVNRFSVALIGPKYLPRLNLENGFNENLKTFVVIPTFLAPLAKMDEQIEQLETFYLANTHEFVYFALLTDWPDSQVEVSQHDQLLLDFAFEKIAHLNKKYYTTNKSENIFFIFHRRRLYNKQEGKWMGWERKRGKLHEFNKLLLGHKDTSFIFSASNPITIPDKVRYVVTLDADTKLPIGAVAQLVGTLAHPLNRACFDLKKQKVIEGYGILQPRVTASLPSREDFTLFQRFSAERSGVDPYASAISDVYQDLFSEGSFTGKGIYDIEAFEASLKNRIPENTLLSHDLFEGNFARCGFLSDCEFFEDFPSHTGVAALRTHRWTRGDWQLLPWIFGRRGFSISLIGRWKMIDNLRRSLTPIMTFFTLILPPALLDSNWAPWLILAFISLGISAIINFITEIFPKPRVISWAQHLSFVIQDFNFACGRSLFYLALLPYHAWIYSDAIARALFRLFVSHRLMLEWTTAEHAKSTASLKQKDFWKSMIGALFLIIFAILILTILNLNHLIYILPLILVWLISPSIAYYCSIPPSRHPILPVNPENIKLLHLSARRIWRFFSTFVTAEDKFLPPDNFQEDPSPIVAHRSSPTNFGLYLLSIFAAHDFGWIGLFELSERLEKTLQSLESLPKHLGHFYNWYDTTEGRPLEPKYISSVDNGNIAGHLLTVAQACLEKRTDKVILSINKKGIQDTLNLLELSLHQIAENNYTLNFEAEEVRKACSILASCVLQQDHFSTLQKKSRILLEAAEKLAFDHPNDFDCSEILYWATSIDNEISSLARDFFSLIGWTDYAKISTPDFFSHQQELAWSEIKIKLVQPVPLYDLPQHSEKLIHSINSLLQLNPSLKLQEFFNPLINALETTKTFARTLEQKLFAAHQICYHLFHQMDFNMLYDPVRRLFSIGLRVSDNTLDESYYDLLASEARLTSFIAIAKGDVPVAHWFRLGRTLTTVENGTALVSWSGSMFEYLMPCLVMHTPQGSLLEQTCRLAIRRQITYAKSKGVAWGISESAYNKRDLHLTYQYSNFGVPDLGLKYGLGADLVVSPYASFLAAMFGARDAAENLIRLEKDGLSGPYGFYEAIDYTQSRLPPHQNSAIVKAYMTHHQGMSLIALANVFKGGIMRKRFHSEPLVHATQLLLQERVPRHVSTIKPNIEMVPTGLVREVSETVSRRYHRVDRPIPTTGIISNGNYTVMVTSAGSGFSRFREIALTRWREDVTRDQWGSYFFLRDLTEHKVWSVTYQPTCVTADFYEVDFAEDRARFSRRDYDISSKLEIIVSPDDSAEVRKITLTNLSEAPRQIELTSYSEIVINSQGADIAHPTFSNLFVQTEYVPEVNALFAKRRSRSDSEKPLWIAQVLTRSEQCFGVTEYETDRAQFIGRGRSVQNPQALFHDLAHRKLTQSIGSVLDPIFSLRTKIWLNPGTSTEVIYSTLIAENREELLLLAEKFHARPTYEKISNTAWTQAQVKLNHLNIDPNEANQFQRLATRLIFSDSSLRPSSEILKRNKKDLTGLWTYGVSGDFPIVLLRIDDLEDRGIVRQLLKFQEYLATKRFVLDIIIINEKGTSYAQELQNSLEAMVHSSTMAMQALLPHSGGKVFILRADLLPKVDIDLLYSEARVALSSRLGSLAEQILRVRSNAQKPKVVTQNLYNISPQLISLLSKKTNRIDLDLAIDTGLKTPTIVSQLQFFNGLGGFTNNGREYIIILSQEEQTPAPWINVIANHEFGFQVSESGSGYTWALNSRENQLTPWSNDPICDPCGEALYIADQDSGELWSPTALPIRIKESKYITRHGQGYSTFEHSYREIHSELTQFVMPEDSIKVSHWIIENKSTRTRNLSVTGYVEWVLGFSRATMAPSTITERDEETGLIFANNSRNIEFGDRISFAGFVFDKSIKRTDHLSYTGDRSEFIGRNGNLQAPAGAAQNTNLSGRLGASLDPCAAQKFSFKIEPGAKLEITFILGQAKNRQQARTLIHKLQQQKPNKILTEVIAKWNNILNKVQVDTPDPAFNIMLNRWLLYQTLVCRIWARSAFYQAGGAFGFRDQLQDVMALLFSQPILARQQILCAARRQFVEGDVQHWWHPPTGRGVRTHFSDDLLWLPYVTHQYLKVTGDFSILEEELSFIEGPLLNPNQEDSYFTPTQSHRGASLYEHCALTLDYSLKTGTHGLPLIGGGDWNDGMNRVGKEGKGESVWLAWFLYANLVQFATIAQQKNQDDRAAKWQQHALNICAALEREAWDGEWYRRAFYDDGKPLGAHSCDECKIDSLAQTWAVISGASTLERQHQAMQSLEKYLVRSDDQLILLFTPPFDKTLSDPGYIKGYLPGIRENGGQYTHAAAWCVIAHALLGNGKRAIELFSMLNPINHGLNPQDINRYKLEPYVLAGDVYGEPPHTGRGGWSWYTGSAGWMYRAGLEYILGFSISGNILSLNPKLSSDWPGFKIYYLFENTNYTIEVKIIKDSKISVEKSTIDGKTILDPLKIQLVDDNQPHFIYLVRSI